MKILIKKHIIRLFLFFYINFKRSNFLRNLIKKIIGDDKIEIAFNDFKVKAGVKTAFEIDVVFNSYNEVMVLELIKSYTLKGYNFIDIGANIGLHSLTAASSNPTIEIYSFEPEPNNYQNFVENIVLNKYLNIRPFKMGLGDFSINKTLNINEGWNKGKHSLKLNFEGSNKKINIPLTTLDSFKENIKFEKLIIKIDVEGYEKEAIDGAKSVFYQTENIILIIELLQENNGFLNCEVITNNLIENKFECIYKISDNNNLHKVDGFKGSADYIFVKGIDAKKHILNHYKC
ncbi:FkbM family methyltransferase [Flavobacterium sp. WC2509]|uniref:FkbM family methyltransferase n=1 Tax=Flavobacterium sp. WC2509 TaxID=3461406 RepID=UPI004043B97A